MNDCNLIFNLIVLKYHPNLEPSAFASPKIRVLFFFCTFTLGALFMRTYLTGIQSTLPFFLFNFHATLLLNMSNFPALITCFVLAGHDLLIWLSWHLEQRVFCMLDLLQLLFVEKSLSSLPHSKLGFLFEYRFWVDQPLLFSNVFDILLTSFSNRLSFIFIASFVSSLYIYSFANII